MVRVGNDQKKTRNGREKCAKAGTTSHSPLQCVVMPTAVPRVAMEQANSFHFVLFNCSFLIWKGNC